MQVRRLTGSLGAVVDGVRLETIDDHEFKELHDALLTHQVVFLPDQHLSEDGHRALAVTAVHRLQQVGLFGLGG